MIRIVALLFALLPNFAISDEVLKLDSSDYQVKLTHIVMHPKAAFPGDEIAKDQYGLAEKPKTMRVRFSKDRSEFKIVGTDSSGSLKSGNAEKRVYEFKRGLFAGGELIFESTDDGLICVLTTFGSGVPIISSEYGKCEAVAEKDK